MNLRNKKGSISIFVLVALLFMSSILILLFARNVNKSKVVEEQFNIISEIYAYGGGDEGAYEKAYTDLRKKNKQTMTASSENSNDLKLTKTFDDNISNYKIYGNSVQDGTPSPTNPVEIKSVGNTNLLNPDVMNLDNWLAATEIGNQNGKKFIINLDVGEYYFDIDYITEQTDYGYLYIYRKLPEETEWEPCARPIQASSFQKHTLITIEKGHEYCLWWWPNDEELFYNLKEWQIRKSADEKSYVEYGKYKIPVRVSGKNLLNPNAVQDLNVYINSNTGGENIPSSTGGTWRVSDYIYITEYKTYHLNAINNDASVAGMAWYDINKNYISGLSAKKVNENNGNMTAPENAKYLKISWRIDKDYNPNWKDTVQLEEGNKATEYLPYQEEQTFNIYLDEPLRKIGNYADYIDFKSKKVIRQIDYYKVTGEESIILYKDSESLNQFHFEISEKTYLHPLPAGVDTNVMCNYYKASNINKRWNNFNTVYTHSTGFAFNDKNYSIVKDFRDMLSSANESGIPVTINFILATPTEYTIDLPELKSYEDYTKIEVLTEVEPSKIEAEYVGYTLD